VDSIVVRPDPTWVQEIFEWPAPTSAQLLKSFMGGINLYHKFVYHFSQLARPFHHLTNKKKLIWYPHAQHHFDNFKTYALLQSSTFQN
jgi:hypothetical protein